MGVEWGEMTSRTATHLSRRANPVRPVTTDRSAPRLAHTDKPTRFSPFHYDPPPPTPPSWTSHSRSHRQDIPRRAAPSRHDVPHQFFPSSTSRAKPPQAVMTSLSASTYHDKPVRPMSPRRFRPCLPVPSRHAMPNPFLPSGRAEPSQSDAIRSYVPTPPPTCQTSPALPRHTAPLPIPTTHRPAPSRPSTHLFSTDPVASHQPNPSRHVFPEPCPSVATVRFRIPLSGHASPLLSGPPRHAASFLPRPSPTIHAAPVLPVADMPIPAFPIRSPTCRTAPCPPFLTSKPPPTVRDMPPPISPSRQSDKPNPSEPTRHDYPCLASPTRHDKPTRPFPIRCHTFPHPRP